MHTVLKYQNEAVISCPPASGEIGDGCHGNRARQGSYTCTDTEAALAPLSNGGTRLTRVCHCQSARRLWQDSWRHAVLKHATNKTDPCDPLRMGVKSTTISNHPNTPLKHRVSCPHKTVYILTIKHDTS